MMAAIRAGELRGKVILVEKNASLGKKLLLTGKCRCNLTNACGPEEFLERFSGRGQFLRDAFKAFFNKDLMSFFEERGVSVKTERQQRVFPVTDKSTDILEVLQKELLKHKVKIIYNAEVKEIITEKGAVKSLRLNNGAMISCGAVILATGGVSYPSTGSTGDGLRIAEQLGHVTVKPMPGLVPLIIKENYPKLLEGLALKNIRLVFTDGKKTIVSEVGELLFTGFGISGPLVLTLSGRIVDWLSQGKNVYVDIDLKPALSEEQINERLLREIKQNPKKLIKNLLKDFLPARLIDVFLDISKVRQDTVVSYITQENRKTLASVLKALRFRVFKARPLNTAMITRGGVSLKNIDPRTMTSRIVKGLYFAGEIIDVDADTGGFNLQAAFSTGYLAGESAAGFSTRLRSLEEYQL